LYYLGIDNKEATFNRGTAQEIRHTIGTRFWGNHGPLDYDLEALFQLGSFGNTDIRAWSVAPGVSYNLRSVSLSPQVEARFIATSGDKNPETGALGTFNPLFPTAIYFGQGVINLNGPSNLIGVRSGAKFQLAEDVFLSVDYDFLWRQSLQDGGIWVSCEPVALGLRKPSPPYRQPAISGIYWQVDQHFSLSAAYTHFSPGHS
jgi:hypothetical protein